VWGLGRDILALPYLLTVGEVRYLHLFFFLGNACFMLYYSLWHDVQMKSKNYPKTYCCLFFLYFILDWICWMAIANKSCMWELLMFSLWTDSWFWRGCSQLCTVFKPHRYKIAMRDLDNIIYIILHNHFIIYHDITYNQKHRFRHQFMIVCNLEESLYGIFSLEVAILKMVS